MHIFVFTVLIVLLAVILWLPVYKALRGGLRKLQSLDDVFPDLQHKKKDVMRRQQQLSSEVNDKEREIEQQKEQLKQIKKDLKK